MRLPIWRSDTTAHGVDAGAPGSISTPDRPERKELGHREFKRQLVEEDRAHAALVFDGDVAVAWAEYGPVEELPNIHHRKEWEQGLVRMPDYRITCLFVDRRCRRKGIAAVAARGALALIAAAGGGLVESYPHDLPPGKKTSASFLYNATRSMYGGARLHRVTLLRAESGGLAFGRARGH